MKFITVSELKQRATQVVSEIESSREEVIVTKNGKRVVLMQYVTDEAFSLNEKETRKEGKKDGKGIYRRGNVYWIRYAGLDGRIIRESSRSDKFREAEALLIQRKQKRRQAARDKKIVHHTVRSLPGKI